MFDVDGIKTLLHSRLSKKRYNHSLNVAAEARKLAFRYGVDPDRAYAAGLLHDICKEEDNGELKRLMLNCGNITNAELASKPLWHAGMSELEEITYLADLISKDRDYKDVEKMRKLAYSDFYKAMLEAVGFSVSSVVKKHGYIPEYSIEAYNQYNYLYLIRKKNKEKK